MTTSIGFALGIGSGLDIKSLVDDLAAATKAPREALIARRESANEAKISKLAEVSGAIDSFASALSSLVGGGTLFSQPSVSDTSLFTATALAGARLGSLSAEIEVRELAKAQTLESVSLASRTDPVGQGDLTLTTASGSFVVSIGAGNDSLDGLAKAINDAAAGVTASVVTDSGGARLVIKGATGAANAFTLDVPAGTVSGLERFAYGPSVTGGMSLAQEARDAIVELDGVEVRRSTNSFSDLISGVQIDLKKAAPGSLVSVGLTRPTAAIEQAVQDFVGAYNELMKMIAEATAPGASGEGGALRGDLGVREMQRQLGQLSSAKLSSQGDGPHTLAELGVRTNRDGTLSVDDTRLKAILESDPEGVEALFNPSQYSSSPFLSIASAMGRVKPGTYTITNVSPAAGAVPAAGKIDGLTASAAGSFIIAPAGSNAVGLILEVKGAVTSATVTVDPGLGGALQAIRDALRSSHGPFTATQDRLSAESKAIAKDREIMEQRAEKYHDQLLTTFTAMDRQVSAFKATQSYLEQQIKMWTADRD